MAATFNSQGPAAPSILSGDSAEYDFAYDMFLKSSEGSPFNLQLLKERPGPSKYYYDFLRDGFGQGNWVEQDISAPAQSAQSAFTSWLTKTNQNVNAYKEYLDLTRKNPGRSQNLLAVHGSEISPTLLSENKTKGGSLLG